MDNMEYTTDFKIGKVTTVNSNSEFNDLIVNVEIICEITSQELDKPIELPLFSTLSIPSNTENYIQFDDITKEQLVEWVLVDNQYKIDNVFNKNVELQRNKSQVNQSTNTNQNIVVKSFIENELGEIQLDNTTTPLENVEEEDPIV